MTSVLGRAFSEGRGGDYIMRRFVYTLPNVIKEEGIGVA